MDDGSCQQKVEIESYAMLKPAEPSSNPASALRDGRTAGNTSQKLIRNMRARNLTIAPDPTSVHRTTAPVGASVDDELSIARQLASDVLAGDSQAESRLYARYSDQLLLILQRRGAPREAAEDVSHDAFLVLLEHLRAGDLAEPDKLGRYLKRTAINLWINKIRKDIRHGEVQLSADDDVADPQHDEEEISRAEVAALVREVVNELTQERDRLILWLLYVYDWDKQSICNYLEIEPRVFDNVRSRAIKRCRQIIEKRSGKYRGIREVVQPLPDD